MVVNDNEAARICEYPCGRLVPQKKGKIRVSRLCRVSAMDLKSRSKISMRTGAEEVMRLPRVGKMLRQFNEDGEIGGSGRREKKERRKGRTRGGEISPCRCK